jgi:hypothetical protein
VDVHVVLTPHVGPPLPNVGVVATIDLNVDPPLLEVGISVSTASGGVHNRALPSRRGKPATPAQAKEVLFRDRLTAAGGVADRRGNQAAAPQARDPGDCREHAVTMHEALLERGCDYGTSAIAALGPPSRIDHRASRGCPRLVSTEQVDAGEPSRAMSADVMRQARWAHVVRHVYVNLARLVATEPECGERGQSGDRRGASGAGSERGDPDPFAMSDRPVVCDEDSAMTTCPPSRIDEVTKPRLGHETQRLTPADHAVLVEQQPCKVVGIVTGYVAHDRESDGPARPWLRLSPGCGQRRSLAQTKIHCAVGYPSPFRRNLTAQWIMEGRTGDGGDSWQTDRVTPKSSDSREAQ